MDGWMDGMGRCDAKLTEKAMTHLISLSVKFQLSP
jgi:hypothetical protein